MTWAGRFCALFWHWFCDGCVPCLYLNFCPGLCSVPEHKLGIPCTNCRWLTRGLTPNNYASQHQTVTVGWPGVRFSGVCHGQISPQHGTLLKKLTAAVQVTRSVD
jgi:hypothetical protein